MRCPGVPETTWKQYKQYTAAHPTGFEGNPQIGLFPQCLQTHGFVDYAPHSASIHTQHALEMKVPERKPRDPNTIPQGWMRPEATFLTTNANGLMLLPSQDGYEFK